jgi:small subunit ribosomal protein S8e
MSGSKPTLTGLAEKKKIVARALGGHTKERLLFTNAANVLDPKTGKYTQATISTIVENPANRNYARRNIMTRGTIIETSAGRAKVTNRPGQQGAINAVLV